MRVIFGLFVAGFAFMALAGGPASAGGAPGGTEAAGGAHTQAQPASGGDSLTPEARMNRRFPQNVRAGDLVGLPLLDYDDRTLGHVTQVDRAADGKIVLVVNDGGWFGWGGRSVAVPIEAVAVLGRQIALLDMSREDFFALQSWTGADDTPIDANQTIRIAITRR